MSNMNSLCRSSGVALLSLVLVGVTGCQPDNEKAVTEQQSKASGGTTAPPNAGPPPKNQADYGQRQQQQQQQQNPYKSQGYPGAK